LLSSGAERRFEPRWATGIKLHSYRILSGTGGAGGAPPRKIWRNSMISRLTALALIALAFCAPDFTVSAAERTTAIAVGDKAPAFELVDHTGARVSFVPGDGATTVLVFYRGSWCPFCFRQLSDLRGLLAPTEKVRLYAISIDPPETSAKLAEKIGKDGKGEVTYRILSDPGHKTIDAFGIRNHSVDGDRFEGIPHPAVFVVDGTGTVRWSQIDEDYKNRPTNDQIRTALGALAK